MTLNSLVQQQFQIFFSGESKPYRKIVFQEADQLV